MIYPQPQAFLVPLRQVSSLRIQVGLGPTWEHIDINMGYKDKGDPLLKKKFVREALMRGVNRQAIVNALYHATGIAPSLGSPQQRHPRLQPEGLQAPLGAVPVQRRPREADHAAERLHARRRRHLRCARARRRPSASRPRRATPCVSSLRRSCRRSGSRPASRSTSSTIRAVCSSTSGSRPATMTSRHVRVGRQPRHHRLEQHLRLP